jgi:hypothetical protein
MTAVEWLALLLVAPVVLRLAWRGWRGRTIVVPRRPSGDLVAGDDDE